MSETAEEREAPRVSDAAEQPLRRFRFADGHLGWYTTKHSVCRSIMADARFVLQPVHPLGGQDDGGAEEAFAGPESAGDLLRIDPPQHTRVRQSVTRYFTVRQMEQKRPMFEEVVADHLRAMEQAGSPLDLVETFALPVASISLCHLLGVPASERRRFETPSTVVTDPLGTTPEEKKQAMRDFYDFVWGVIQDKRARPGDDLLSQLVLTSDLTDDELKGLTFLLFIAGHETTATMFTASAFFLLSQRDRWEAARADPSSIGVLVEELLRYLMTANTDVPRTALEDVEIDGVLIKRGEAVAVVPGRPGGDLAACPHLHGFDPTHDAGGHLAFGQGRHMCLGQHLARLELQIGLEGLMRHFPTLHLASPPEESAWHSSEGLSHNIFAHVGKDPLLVAW